MEKAGLLFLAGFASIAFPCVLPLVPGYLSAVSAVDAQRLGDPGVGRRVAIASLPFIAGFAIVLALPLGIWLFAPLRNRATASIAVFDERRRRDREQLRSRLRGDEPPSS